MQTDVITKREIELPTPKKDGEGSSTTKRDIKYMCICGHIRRRDKDISSCTSSINSAEYFCGFLDCLNDKSTSDLVIKFGDDTEFYAHRFVLSFWGSIFKTMFIGSRWSNSSESQNSILNLDSLNPKASKLFIEMLYYLPQIPCGIISTKNVFMIFHISHMYGVPALMKVCTSLVMSELKMMETKTKLSDKEITSLAYIGGMVLTNWGSEYGSGARSKEISDILKDTFAYAIQLILINLNKIKNIPAAQTTFITKLNVEAMDIILSTENADVYELDLLTLLFDWIMHHYTTRKITFSGVVPGSPPSPTIENHNDPLDESRLKKEDGGEETTNDDHGQNTLLIIADEISHSGQTGIANGGQISCFATDGEIDSDNYDVTCARKIGQLELALLEKIRWGLLTQENLAAVQLALNNMESLPHEFVNRAKDILLEAIFSKISPSSSTGPEVKCRKFPYAMSDKKRKISGSNQGVSKRIKYYPQHASIR